MCMRFIFVALGGAVGAMGRYAISLIPTKTGFPVLTLITNIAGAILIGFIVGIVNLREDISPHTALFWKTGVCGGFTTFSTFSLEAVSLLLYDRCSVRKGAGNAAQMTASASRNVQAGAYGNILYEILKVQERGVIMKANGTVFRYGDNVDTDVIIPARYLNSSDPAELATHCMEDIDRDFVKKVQKGDIIVADKNFGCGSSREHAPIAIKAAGVSCVIAETFARIFYRNAINIGLPIIECPEAAKGIEAGDQVEVDFDSGMIYNRTRGTQFKGQAFPEFMQKIIAAEGLINYINNK